jgi:acyl-CoA dehydrogenase
MTPTAAADRSETTELARSLDASLAAILPLTALLEAVEHDRPLGADVQQALLGLGWAGMAVDESLGGLGLDAEARTALAAVAGRRLLPAAMRSESVLLAPALAALAAGGSAEAAGWLDGLLEGRVRGGGVVVAAPAGGSRAGELLVPLAPGAELVAVLAADRAVVVALDDTASVEPFDALDRGQGYARVALGDALGRADRTIDGPRARALLAQWRLAVLGEAYGAGQRALELSAEFAGQREQFGKPIAGFQAVAHRLAAMAVELEACDAGIGRLAAGFEHEEATEDLGRVLLHRVPAGMRTVCESAIQVHGGMGFTWELGLHLHYRRVLSLQYEAGGHGATAAAIGAAYLANRKAAHV